MSLKESFLPTRKTVPNFREESILDGGVSNNTSMEITMPICNVKIIYSVILYEPHIVYF